MLRATSNFYCEVDGVGRHVPAGAIVRPDDPVVSGRESLFVEADSDDQSAAPRRRVGKAKG